MTRAWLQESVTALTDILLTTAATVNIVLVITLNRCSVSIIMLKHYDDHYHNCRATLLQWLSIYRNTGVFDADAADIAIATIKCNPRVFEVLSHEYYCYFGCSCCWWCGRCAVVVIAVVVGGGVVVPVVAAAVAAVVAVVAAAKYDHGYD